MIDEDFFPPPIFQHTPNHNQSPLMHSMQNNSDTLQTPIVPMTTPSFPGMPTSFPSALPSAYQGYDIDTGQMGGSYNVSSIMNQQQIPSSMQR